jgi:hypothetical protein
MTVIPTYRADDLRVRLEEVRGRPVPLATLKFWRIRLGISPDRNRLYTQSELDALCGLVEHLKLGGTIEQYRRIKLAEQMNNDN